MTTISGSPVRGITVASGDTLSGIARRNGVELDALLKANPDITNPNLIRVGQQIRLPVDTFERAAPPVTTAAPKPTPPTPATKPAAPPAPGLLGRIGQTVSSWWSGLFSSTRPTTTTGGVSSTAPVLKRGDRGPEVVRLQDQLVALGRLSVRDKLSGPGLFGPKTEGALRSFQAGVSLPADGTVTAKTRSALDKAQAALGYDKRPVIFGRHPSVSAEFKQKTVGIAERLSMDPDHLMGIMAFESGGTFSPSVKNPDSGATGLIQFIPSTARGLGTSLDALAKMTAVEQLDYVEHHLGPLKGRLNNLEDAYMAVLLPSAAGKPNDYVLFKKGTRAYEQNSGLDTDHDDQITKGEAAGKVRERFQEGLKLRG